MRTKALTLCFVVAFSGALLRPRPSIPEPVLFAPVQRRVCPWPGAASPDCVLYTASAGGPLAIVTAWDFAAGHGCPECFETVSAYCRRLRCTLLVVDSGAPRVRDELGERDADHVKTLALAMALRSHDPVLWVDAHDFVGAPDVAPLDFFPDAEVEVVAQDAGAVRTRVLLLRPGAWSDFVLRHAWAAAPRLRRHAAAFQHALHAALEAFAGGAYPYGGACVTHLWLHGDSCWRWAHLASPLLREPCLQGHVCVGPGLLPAPFLLLVPRDAPVALECAPPARGPCALVRHADPPAPGPGWPSLLQSL